MNPLNASSFKDAPYKVCFTPGSDCAQEIVNEIDLAKKSIFVQAYSFTSAPIAKAIVNAKKRGVEVNVILDKGQFSQKYSSAKFLQNQGIPLWKDSKPAIAHNKIIIIDTKTVITGSFNFTKAAQERNAENVLIISDATLANKYKENWDKRQSASIKELPQSEDIN
ncbi:phospholipase D family protein [Fluviispira multicolorata]|uniref:phospholipase D n=2 Tax=Fluviispira multicolorata TaxID=2654512 RepID=A0A833JI71_9BACT|nr:phospholipase D family protein [Fluviispira multicolorata]